MQDAVHDKMLNTGRVLKRDPAQPAQLLPAGASPPQAARSAPQGTGANGRQLGRMSSSHGAIAAQPERHGGQKHDESGMSRCPHVHAYVVSLTMPVSRTAQKPARSSLARSACACMQQMPRPLPSTISTIPAVQANRVLAKVKGSEHLCCAEDEAKVLYAEAVSARTLPGKGLAKPQSQANFASLASPGVRRMSSGEL